MVLCSEVGVGWAEEPGAQSAAPEAESAPPKTEGVAPKVDKAPKPVESAAPKSVEKCCPAPVAPPKKPAPCPVYVSDLERLAALTASDPVVFERADSLASRDNYVGGCLCPVAC